MDLREQKFGIEIEMTGITRAQAGQIIADHFNAIRQNHDGPNGEYYAIDTQERK